MMKILLLSMLLMVAMTSCSETKNTAASAITSSNTPTGTDMTAEGFLAGIVKASADDSGCPYTIDARDSQYLYDPINLDDEYKKDGTKVWFKFHALRMQSRCTEATPIEITEMQMIK